MDNNYEIIGLGGRCYSGKSELAKICKDFGYEILSFGLPLKKLIAGLINVTVDDVNRLKKVESKYVFSDVDYFTLSNETEIPFDIIKNKLDNIIFKNTRELMQIIGTDIIREYNKDWHVNKLKEEIKPNHKYIFDDVRFPNEKKMIEDLGGTCWFIARPDMEHVSNHVSETSLTWKDFDNVIINDSSLEYLKFNWKLIFENGYDNSMTKRNSIIETLSISKKPLNSIVESIEKFSVADMLFISKYPYTYSEKIKNLSKDDIAQISVSNKKMLLDLKNGEKLTVSNPLEIEDLKMFL